MSFDPINLEKGINKTPSSKVAASLKNNTGSTLSKQTVVRIGSSSEVQSIDITNKLDVYSIFGVVESDILDDEDGIVLSNGLLEDITTTASVGDIIYLSKSSDFLDDIPEIGNSGFVEGDFVVKIGTVLENKDNALKKDILINIQVIGQL